MSEKNVSGITKIAVEGFKSIAEERAIDIRPLTILAGANSSGKSSIMQPFLMLKQTLEAPYDPGPLLIDGPNIQFTFAEQFLSVIGEKKASCFQIRIETCDIFASDSVTTTFRKGQQEIEIAEMIMESERWDGSSQRLILYPDMPPAETKSQADQHRKLDEDSDDVVKRSRCFLDFGSEDGEITLDITEDIEYHIVHTIHLPRLRGNPERTYKLASTGPWYPGTFENYVVSLVYEWQETKDKRLKTLADALHTLGISGLVGTEKINDAHIELRVGRLLHNRTDEADMVNIADVGFGVSQVLPILVALIAAEQGRLVYIEQPELHLHPRAQVALAYVLADAAKRGVRVVAETHSSLLLLGIQTLVAEGNLSPELVKLHWFTRREDGVTEVNSVDLDEAGTYGDWPVDFDDVSLNAQSRFLDAVDNVKFGNKETS